MTIRWDMDWIIGFIDTLFTPLETTGNYSTVTKLHTLQFTVTHTLGFSVFTSHILATDFQHSSYKSHWNCRIHEVFLAQPNSFLAVSSQSSSTAISGDSLNSNFSWPVILII
jgi:hypothetical protein